MNLCIDIGNTSSKAAFFEDESLVRLEKEVSDRNVLKLIGESKPDQIIISSVRKGISRFILKAEATAQTIVLTHETNLPIQISYDTPATLGVDRIASVVGAQATYPGQHCLVIDIGTCITYDILDKDGMYHGGGISPGVDMRLKAMHKFTSKLPLISPKGSPDLIGKTTKEAMLTGAINGAIAEIKGIIDEYRQFYSDLTIIFCGGGAIFFESKIKGHIFALPNLVLIGLNRILRFNFNA